MSPPADEHILELREPAADEQQHLPDPARALLSIASMLLFRAREDVGVRRPQPGKRPMIDPIPVSGLFEAHLTVNDLERSTAFYRDVVGLRLALEAPASSAVFFWVGGPGHAMLGLWAHGAAPMELTLHLAFSSSLEDVLSASERLRSLGVTPLSIHGAETRNQP